MSTDDPSPLPFVKGRLLVKLGHTVSPVIVVDAFKALGAKLLHSFNLVEGLHLYQFDENTSIEEARLAFLKNKAVLYAEPDFIYKTQVIEDSEYSKQWALENTSQSGGTVDADINAEAGWAIEQGSNNVVIGVIDTGIDYSHPDLAANVWSNSSEIPGNNKDDDQNGYVDDIHGVNAINGTGNPMDDNKHGTHVSGTIAASSNTIGIRGVAPGVRVAGCKFLSSYGSGAISDAIKCMEYFAALKSRATNPVNLVATSNSWGGGAASEAMLDAIKAHEKLGILFIAAAGNSTANNDDEETYPCNYRVPNVISVAATDNNDALAGFSNFGKKTVHVAAPGVKVLSTVLRSGYAELSGTSMAAPHVSGLAALIASHFPNYKYGQIKNLIQTGGQSIAALKSKTISGKRIRVADANGVGSLTCVKQTQHQRQSPSGNVVKVNLGSDILLSATVVTCADSAISFELQNNRGVSLVLTDEGAGGDAIAKDGILSLRWAPKTAGEYRLDFGEGDIVTIQVINANTENPVPPNP
jgi:subtilisin family serine protease